ncbi:MAG TPA: hypothetical protein VG674_02870 [Amycolatopsis sp.]|nr:hypothetical protein [Amycolatopsis sp.]
MAAPDFDTVADDLYAGESGDFVASRTAAARAAKQAGDADLARRIQALRKPTSAAFHVNRLARAGSTALRELAEVGEQLRAAHANLAGTELRELSERRARLVRVILRESPDLSDAVAREVEETLETMVADPAVARLVLAGRLTSVAHQDADQWLSLPAPAGRPGKSAEKNKPAAPPRKSPARAAPEKSEKDRADREEHQRKLTAAKRDRAEASRALVRAERIADQADARLNDLRERLADAEERARTAADELASARSAFEAADKALGELD